jgi:hypothetical protein
MGRIKKIFMQGGDNEGEERELDLDEFYTSAWNAVPEDLKAEGIAVLRREIKDPTFFHSISEGVRKYGLHEWDRHPPFSVPVDVGNGETITYPWHMSGGMGIRNLLRQGGVTDDRLPDNATDSYYGEGTNVKNLDDYYIQWLEAAVGAR